MKTVETIRGGQEYPLVLDNGDRYDSVSLLHDESGKVLYIDPLVNTDFTENYHGGILAEGEYYAICGHHKGKYKALKLFMPINGIGLTKIHSEGDFARYPEVRVLPSLIPNPNHDGKSIISDINDHAGGTDSYDLHGQLIHGSWDYSHGCITRPAWLYGKWMSFFEPNEIVRYVLKRGKYWTMPEVQ